LGRLHHGQVGRLLALEDADIDAGLTKGIIDVGAVAHQAAGLDMVAVRKRRWKPMQSRERGQLDAPAREENVASDVQGFGAVAQEGGDVHFARGSETAPTWRASFTARSSNASSAPCQPMNERPIGQPEIEATGRVTCGSPLKPARQVSRMTRTRNDSSAS